MRYKMTASGNDNMYYHADCPICNSEDVGVINQMLLNGMKFSKIMEAFKGRLRLTNHLLRVHKRDHFDGALRADLIDSIQKGKIKVHNTASLLYELIQEWEEVYSAGKDNLITNLNDPDITVKNLNALKGLFQAQKELLKFNAALLKEVDEGTAAQVDLTKIAHALGQYKKKVEPVIDK
jgi:hypothetical protein